MTIPHIQIEHILLTRYNLPIPGRIKNLDNEWLAYRHQLFAQYCVPSVANQTSQHFRWFILADSQTPQKHLRKIRQIIPPNASIILLTENINQRSLKAILKQAEIPHSAALLTSRLDSDDCLGVRYIELTRMAAARQIFGGSNVITTALNFPVGLQLRGGEVYALLDLDNPFISLLECPGSRQTVLAVSHRDIQLIAPVKQITYKPQWLQTIHACNIDNDVRGLRMPQWALGRSFKHIDRKSLPRESCVALAFGFSRSVARLFARATAKARRAGARG